MRAYSLLAFIVCAFLTQISHAQVCYQSSIMKPTPFMGNNGEIFQLADGTLWEVMYEYEYLYEYYPDVIVCPSMSRLIVHGKQLNVRQLSGSTPHPQSGSLQQPSARIIESRIDGEFTGWEGETIFKLMNGQIWQQASYAYAYSYKYSPQVIIFPVGGGFEMQVEGLNQRIRVIRLR